MTAADLRVYGKRIGSLWDRRIGGRYELTAIRDTGGTGLCVTLRRVDGGHELAMSVHNLGVNYMSVPEQAEPAEDMRCLACGSIRVCDYNGWCEACSPPAVPAPSADVPLAAWRIKLLTGERLELRFGDPVALDGGLYRVVDADGKAILEPEPVPAPPLPWIEHPRAWWQHEDRFGAVWPSSNMRTVEELGDWQRVAVIPWDLIERFRQSADLAEAIMRDKALLDAADGVTS